MGRLLGSHDSDDLNRPDLNKCPDCGCFFAQDNCPLCGKECPEEMRAGNRKPVKAKKQRRSGRNRVTFVDWYHSWWFIILMMFIFPLAGIILLATSPHKRSSKIIFIILAVLYSIISSFGIGNIIGSITDFFDKPVDTSLSESEYMAKCESVTAEDFYRNVGKYQDEFVTMELVIEKKLSGTDDIYSHNKYHSYYLCRGRSENGNDYSIIVRDCQKYKINFMPGDIIKPYGEGQGNVTIYDTNYESINGAGINAAIIERIQY